MPSAANVDLDVVTHMSVVVDGGIGSCIVISHDYGGDQVHVQVHVNDYDYDYAHDHDYDYERSEMLTLPTGPL